MFENQNIIQGQAALYYMKQQEELKKKNSLIIQKYNGYKGTYAKRYKASQADKILKELTGEDNNTLSNANELDKVLQEIRSGNIFKYLRKGESKNQKFTVSRAELIEIKERWEQILSLFNKDGVFDEQRFSTVRTQYNNLNTYISLLSQKIASGVQSTNLKGILDKVKAHSSAGSTASAVNGLLNGLLGESLEVQLTNEINKNLNIDQVAIKTGNVKIDGKSIKSDIYVVLAGTEVTVSGNVYRFEANGDILVNGKKEQTTTITAEVEKELLKKGAIGFSAKASNKTIVFHSGYSIQDWIKNDKVTGVYFSSLMNFYQYGTPKGINPGWWERLMLASDIPTIIGHNNLFIVSARKITPTFKYLEQIGKKYQTQLHFSPALVPTKHAGRKDSPLPSGKVVGGAL